MLAGSETLRLTSPLRGWMSFTVIGSGGFGVTAVSVESVGLHAVSAKPKSKLHARTNESIGARLCRPRPAAAGWLLQSAATGLGDTVAVRELTNGAHGVTRPTFCFSKYFFINLFSDCRVQLGSTLNSISCRAVKRNGRSLDHLGPSNANVCWNFVARAQIRMAIQTMLQRSRVRVRR